MNFTENGYTLHEDWFHRRESEHYVISYQKLFYDWNGQTIFGITIHHFDYTNEEAIPDDNYYEPFVQFELSDGTVFNVQMLVNDGDTIQDIEKFYTNMYYCFVKRYQK